MKKILVTGAGGFLGWNVCSAAAKEWDTFGTAFSKPAGTRGARIIKIDLTDHNTLKKAFNDILPDAVIHTAAASDPNYCQANRSEAEKINVTASLNLAGLCADRRIPFAFTSTDLVFDGLKVPYKEEDPVSPVNVYGEQKVRAEQGILKIYPDAAVCRMPLMFGNRGRTAAGFFGAMAAALKEGRELRLFTDEYRTPASGRTAASGLFLAIEKVRGLIHLGGRERVSRYEFGLMMMDIMGVNEASIVRCRQQDVSLAAPRPLDVSLDSSKAYALGYDPLPLREELERLLKRRKKSAAVK
ncbi:MAG: NAD(P)-dependent oxidoreductase [Nitrospirota bacterium]|nr:NAD(P)-dependent oxidoreductase [Nitrospirota bacterium]